MKRRRPRKRNGAGSAVVGFIVGSIIPPLGLGSAFAGYHPGTFWAGASWGGGIAAGLYAIGAIVRAVRAPGAPSGPKPLSAPVVVGDNVTALVPTQDTSPGFTFGGVVHVTITAIDPTGILLTGAINDGKFPTFQGQIVHFDRSAISARG